MIDMSRIIAVAVLAGSIAVPSAPARAGDADVAGVRTTRLRLNLYDLGGTVRSKDTGWDRCADRSEAIGPDGSVIAIRTLDHPHDDEQSFTRVISGVHVTGTSEITIRVHFKPGGIDGKTAVVVVPGDAS